MCNDQNLIKNKLHNEALVIHFKCNEMHFSQVKIIVSEDEIWGHLSIAIKVCLACV